MANTVKEGLPDWVVRLGARPCSPSRALWGKWSAEVPTYCLTFRAVNPKRNQQEWREHWRDEYGKVILHAREGDERMVAEFEVVASFRSSGWGANWQDTFGSSPGWMKPWTRGDVPRSVSRTLASIRSAAPSAKPWDVLAWDDDEVMFVECKADGEPFTKSEQAFIWGAHEVGVPVERFAVVRGAIEFPEREPSPA